MFMCLHAAGLTLIPTSIIGYRAAENASNPADVMLPCIITSFIGTIAAFLIVGIKQKINFKSATLLIALMTIISAIVGRMYIFIKSEFPIVLAIVNLAKVPLVRLTFTWLKKSVKLSLKGIRV